MATNRIPELINDMRAYLDGADNMISVKSMELPKFESPTEDITGIGVMGTISAPVLGHFNSMDFVLNWQVPTRTSTKLAAGKAVSIEGYAAVQIFDGGEGRYGFDQYHVIIKGRVKSHEPGTMEAQKAMNSKTTIEAHYVKIEYNDENMIEVDKYGYKCVIGADDITAEIRKAIGMN